MKYTPQHNHDTNIFNKRSSSIKFNYVSSCIHGDYYYYIDGLIQKRRKSITVATELGLFCIKPSVCVIRIILLVRTLIHIDGLVQACSNSSALAMGLL